MTDGSYKEIQKSLVKLDMKMDTQTATLNDHTTKLAVIQQQVEITNGTVKDNCTDINTLYKLNNERENFQERLIGSFNAYKYLGVLLGAIATSISIYAFFIKP